MATSIAANAWVDPRAEIDEEVVIGPFCTIGAGVRIGRGTRLHNNVTLMGNVTLGADNVLFPNVVIGAEPQDVSYQGSDTLVEIGSGNTFREGVTVNRASEKEDGVTRIGDIDKVSVEHVENLFSTDLAYLQEFYRKINEEGAPKHKVTCTKCSHEMEIDMVTGHVLGQGEGGGEGRAGQG